jgi:alcohol dehydrogenase
VHVPFADAMLVRLPDGMDPVAAASVSDNLTDSWIAVNKGLTKHPHAPVLVLGGTGCLGPFAVDHAYAAGSSSVHYVDGDANRRAVAAKLGATVHEAMPEDFISRFAVIVSATRDRAELKSAFRALRPGGHLSGLAIFFDDTPIPLWDIYLRDITFSTGRPSVRPHVPAVLDLIAKGALHPRDVVSSIIDWEDAPLALIEPSLKPVVVRAAIFAKS